MPEVREVLVVWCVELECRRSRTGETERWREKRVFLRAGATGGGEGERLEPKRGMVVVWVVGWLRDECG